MPLLFGEARCHGISIHGRRAHVPGSTGFMFINYAVVRMWECAPVRVHHESFTLQQPQVLQWASQVLIGAALSQPAAACSWLYGLGWI